MDAALAASEDGAQLWLFGGSVQGGQSQNSVWRYDVPSSAWLLINPVADSRYIEPREGHVITCVRRWLLVAGGSCRQNTGERKQLFDTHVFDTLIHAWDCADDSCWESYETQAMTTRAIQLYTSADNRDNNRLGCRFSHQSTQRSMTRGSQIDPSTCSFVGSSLVLLKQGNTGRQDELKVVHLQLQDELAKKHKQRASLTIIENLEIIETTVTTSSIQLAWVPATRNAHKLVGFKLMASGRDGAVKEVYEGSERSFIVEKLTPATEYIFSVKAIYDDASFLWSESKAVRTLPCNHAQLAGLQEITQPK